RHRSCRAKVLKHATRPATSRCRPANHSSSNCPLLGAYVQFCQTSTKNEKPGNPALYRVNGVMASFHRQNDFANLFAGIHHGMGVSNLFQRECGVNNRADFAFFKKWPHMLLQVARNRTLECYRAWTQC